MIHNAKVFAVRFHDTGLNEILATCAIKDCGLTWLPRADDDSCPACRTYSLEQRCRSSSGIINNYRNYFKEKFGSMSQAIFTNIEDK